MSAGQAKLPSAEEGDAIQRDTANWIDVFYRAASEPGACPPWGDLFNRIASQADYGNRKCCNLMRDDAHLNDHDSEAKKRPAPPLVFQTKNIPNSPYSQRNMMSGSLGLFDKPSLNY